jgi:hypothetical protein
MSWRAFLAVLSGAMVAFGLLALVLWWVGWVE